jgi:hypothetical protein
MRRRIRAPGSSSHISRTVIASRAFGPLFSFSPALPSAFSAVICTSVRHGSSGGSRPNYGLTRLRPSDRDRAKDVRAIDEDVAPVPSEQRASRLFDELRQICREAITAAGGEIVA